MGHVGNLQMKGTGRVDNVEHHHGKRYRSIDIVMTHHRSWHWLELAFQVIDMDT